MAVRAGTPRRVRKRVYGVIQRCGEFSFARPPIFTGITLLLPKPVLAQLGLDAEEGAEMTIEGDALVLRRPARAVRTGWAEAARRIAEIGDEALAMGEFANAADAELVW